MTLSIRRAAALSTVVLTAACLPEGAATRTEMRDAVVEVADLGAADGTQTEMIELTTSFTIGAGVEAAVEELRAFVTSQVPCSTVTVADATLTIDFGELGDACVYRGRTYAGAVSVALAREGDTYHVTHTFDGLTGGTVTLDGTAEVEWDGNVRHVVTDLQYVSERGQWNIEADRTQTFSACDDAVTVCVQVDGTRDWSGPRGDYSMTIDDVFARSIDPVPEQGSYTVLTPKGHEIALSFSRVDADTIAVSVTGGRRDVVFEVTAAGQVSDG